MALPKDPFTARQEDRLTTAAAALGYEIVDIAGFLDLVEEHAKAQTSGLSVLTSRTADMTTANADVLDAARLMAEQTHVSVDDVTNSAARLRSSGEKTRSVAEWVQDLSHRASTVSDTLTAVKHNNQQIATIANQVNTLAINAKIEAARAGDAGRGFAVVAEAINELSYKTRNAAVEISNNIENLTSWISNLRTQADAVAAQAGEILSDASGTDAALGRVEASIKSTDDQAARIAQQAESVSRAIGDLQPALEAIGASVRSTSQGIETTHARVLRLIDTSETIVQSTALMSEHSQDAMFIRAVQDLAQQVVAAMENALSERRITLSGLFDRTYRPIPQTDPEQFLTESTRLMDAVMPDIQEPALTLDTRVVFCAAVDVNGYLPTHNRKFSKPQSRDPVWNAANCRNRRIFNDRVGLKAGQNTDPFLLQVYRRDMGGGSFKMMKDLSAPIFVQGRHWGGLRLAYSFE